MNWDKLKSWVGLASSPTNVSRRELLRAMALGGGLIAGELWIPGQKFFSIPRPAPLPDVANLYLSLHTAGGEATYASYARIAVARSGAGWVINEGVARLAQAVDFPQCTGGAQTLTHIALSDANGNELFVGEMSNAISVCTGVTPRLYDLSIKMT